VLGNSQLLKLCQEVLEKDGCLRFRALGSSMLPSLRPGDVITVGSVEPHTILLGDVILYRQNDRLYAHRVIGKKGVEEMDLLITKGDYVPSSVSCINDYEIMGKVIKIERRGRIIRLDTPFHRWWGRLIAKTSSWLYPFFRVAEVTFHIIFRFIRYIKKETIRDSIKTSYSNH
jgi:signal peptidase I